jgi:hypothetical protein
MRTRSLATRTIERLVARWCKMADVYDTKMGGKRTCKWKRKRRAFQAFGYLHTVRRLRAST